MAPDPEKMDTDFTAFQSPKEASVDRLIEAVDRAYHRPGRMMWRAFVQGMMSAFGMTVGYLIIFTVLFYIFQSLGGLDLLTPSLQKAVQNSLPAQLREATPSPTPAPYR